MAAPILALRSAISNVLQDTDTADFSLVCGFKEWRLHSFILATRSPFFKAAISNNTLEKQEKRIEIRDLDSEVMQQVVNYMYGASIEKRHYKDLLNILEASVRFQMDDLKEYVVSLAKRSITKENVVEVGHIAEMYNIDQLFQDCVDYIVKNDVEVEGDLTPKFAASILTSVQKALKDCKKKIEDTKYVKMRVVGVDVGRDKEGYYNYYRVKKIQKMEKFMKVYCAIVGACFSTRAFYFNGRRINKDDTPENLKIEQNDVIVVLNK